MANKSLQNLVPTSLSNLASFHPLHLAYIPLHFSLSIFFLLLTQAKSLPASEPLHLTFPILEHFPQTFTRLTSFHHVIHTSNSNSLEMSSMTTETKMASLPDLLPISLSCFIFFIAFITI